MIATRTDMIVVLGELHTEAGGVINYDRTELTLIRPGENDGRTLPFKVQCDILWPARLRQTTVPKVHPVTLVGEPAPYCIPSCSP